MSNLAEFGNTAKGLARNPLGIIALFIVLVYGIAALVLGLRGSGLTAPERIPLVWFLALFPVVVLSVFAWLVANHHRKLYGPQDYKDEEHFLRAVRPDLQSLELVPAQAAPNDSPDSNGAPPTLNYAAGSAIPTTPKERAIHRDQVYEMNRRIFLAHVMTPSPADGQEYDISIYLLPHKGSTLDDVERAEFFLGKYWGNRVIEGKRAGGTLGMRVSAYGPFLCTCVVTFKDGEKVLLERYVDFEMGDVLRKALETV